MGLPSPNKDSLTRDLMPSHPMTLIVESQPLLNDMILIRGD